MKHYKKLFLLCAAVLSMQPISAYSEKSDTPPIGQVIIGATVVATIVGGRIYWDYLQSLPQPMALTVHEAAAASQPMAVTDALEEPTPCVEPVVKKEISLTTAREGQLQAALLKAQKTVNGFKKLFADSESTTY